MSSPIHTFVSAEEDKHTLTVHYRTEAGDLGKITFSERDEPEHYRLVMVGIGGRRIQEELDVSMYLKKEGAEGVEIMHTTNAEGVKVKDGVYVTHHIAVKLPQEDAHRLSWQLQDFMHSAEDLVERLSRRTSEIKGISYGNDHISISYDPYGTLKLGLVADLHRFTISYYGVDFQGSAEPVGMTFGFTDETGKKRHVSFSAPAEDVWRMKLELDAFTKALEEKRNPKFEAAATSYTLQHAA